MRFLLVAACLLLLLLPAVATAAPTGAGAGVASLDAEYCRNATASETIVFQADCYRGSIRCSPWFSYWDPIRGRPESFCTV